MLSNGLDGKKLMQHAIQSTIWKIINFLSEKDWFFTILVY